MRNRTEFRDANASEKAISRRARVGARSRTARNQLKPLSLSLAHVRAAKVVALNRRDIRGRPKALTRGRVWRCRRWCCRRAKRAEHFSCFRHKILARSGALILQQHRRLLGGPTAARQFINFDALRERRASHPFGASNRYRSNRYETRRE